MYDSHIFKVRLNVNLHEDLDEVNGGYEQLLPHPNNREDVLCSEEIRLKFDQLNTVLLGYLRTIFKNYYTHNVRPKVSVLLTKPKDLEYELFIFRKYLALMRHMVTKKERRTGKTLEEDLEAIKSGTLGYMRFMATVYRAEKKKIMHTNADLAQHVISIITKLIESKNQEKPMTLAEFTRLCMEPTELEKQTGLIRRWVYNGDATFSEEDQFIRRRLLMRGYLRDLAELADINTASSSSTNEIE